MPNLNLIGANISSDNFPYLMNSTCQKGGQYIFKDKKTNDIALGVHTWENSSTETFKNYQPLNFRQITHYGYLFKTEFEENNQKRELVVSAFNRMIERIESKDKKKNALVRLIHLICDCFKNFFSGFGFKSSLDLAKELVKDLSKHQTAIPNTPIVNEKNTTFTNKPPLPQDVSKTLSQEDTKQVPSKPIQSISNLKTNIGVPGKLTPLEKYKHNPKQCPFLSKKIVYQDIKTLSGESTTALLGLMKNCSGLTEVDLNNEFCAQIVIDALQLCNQETSEQLTTWLKTQDSFHPSLLNACLTVFLDHDRQQIPYSQFAIQTLIKIYIEREWSKLKDTHNVFQMPANDPQLVSILSNLLNNKPNDPITEKLVEWVIDQPEFDLMTFIKWTHIFKNREENKSVGLPMKYPIRDHLFAHLIHNKPEWKERLVDSDLAVYLGLKQAPKSTLNSQMNENKQLPKKQIPSSAKPKTVGLKSHLTQAKSKALLNYKKDPACCPLKDKQIIFQDIKSLAISDESQHSTTSVQGLIKHLSENNNINLHCNITSRVILDTFLCCNFATSEALSEWLISRKDFHVELLKDCLSVFIKMESNNKAWSPLALEILLKHFMDNKWNQVKELGSAPILAVNHLVYVSAVSQMIQNQPNSPTVAKLVHWTLNQEEFNDVTLMQWIHFFDERERTKSTGAPIEYPLKNALIEFLKQKPEWLLKNSLDFLSKGQVQKSG